MMKALGLLLLMMACGMVAAVLAAFQVATISSLLTGFYDTFGGPTEVIFIVVAFLCGAMLPLVVVWKRLGDE